MTPIVFHRGPQKNSSRNPPNVNVGGTLLFSEGFEDSSLTSRGWYDVPSTNIVAQARPGSLGTHSQQVTWAVSGINPNPFTKGRKLFTPSNSMYMSIWLKFSSNWVGSGEIFHPHMFHCLTTEDDVFEGLSFDFLTTYIEFNYQAGSGGLLALMSLQDGKNIDLANIGVNLVGVTENRSSCGCNGSPDGDTPASVDCYDSGGGEYHNGKTWKTGSAAISDATKTSWHHVEAFHQLNTIVGGVSQVDGIFQFQVDGVRVLDLHHVEFRTGAHPTMQFQQFVFAPFIGDGSPAAQSFFMDDLEVWTNWP